MDKIEELAKQASQLTFYDVKSYYNQARNAILNVSPMEAKVREATDPDEPWGASSTLMQEIAQATHNFQHFNEILPLIWSRFHESEARQWRQIYKALTLLEYLVKNGSERVVDDARGHIATVKMLRSFHYTDEKGKDQGINVRNRAKEIAELLSDVERIRAERRKAKANKNKYGGSGNDGSGGGFGGSGSRYGGFGSQDVGRYTAGSSDRYSSGNAYGENRRTDHDSGDVYRTTESRGQPEYDEYDAGDDDDRLPVGKTQPPVPKPTQLKPSTSASRASVRPPVPKEVKQPVVQDLFDFGDDDNSLPVMASSQMAQPAKQDDDDFADFQGAAVAAPAPPRTAPTPSAGASQNVFDLLNSQPSSKPLPTFTNPSPVRASAGFASHPAAKTPSGTGGSANGGFDDLWSSSLAGIGGQAATHTSLGNQSKKSMLDLDREKTMNSLWNAPSAKSTAPFGNQGLSSNAGSSRTAFDDLLG